jgi:hypothetical protein
MHFYIVFQNSGDSFKFESIHHDLVIEYIDFLNNNQANKFRLQPDENILVEIAKLKETLEKLNETVVTDLAGKFTIPDTNEGFIDQHYLNSIHAQWVNHVFKSYSIAELKNSNLSHKLHHLFDTTDDDAVADLSAIVYKYNLQDTHVLVNEQVHILEKMFSNMKFKADFNNWIECPNPYRDYASNSMANFRIAFNHYGRTLRNKFLFHDFNLEHPDENNYNQLVGFTELSLNPAETNQYSPEYVAWCKRNNIRPLGEYLNLGNLIDLEKNLLSYRKVLYKNVLIKDNHFTITIEKV